MFYITFEHKYYHCHSEAQGVRCILLLLIKINNAVAKEKLFIIEQQIIILLLWSQSLHYMHAVWSSSLSKTAL